jgi:hypothetical protein
VMTDRTMKRPSPVPLTRELTTDGTR